MSTNSMITLDRCISWTTPNKNGETSIAFRLHQMVSYLRFDSSYNSDYRLCIVSDGFPADPFDVSVIVIIGKVEVSRCKTTVRGKSEILWRGLKSDLSKVVTDIDQREFLFRIHLLGNTLDKKEVAETDPALASLATSMPSYHSEALSRDLRKLLDAASPTDVEISCGDQVFKANRNVLGVRSEVFGAMLQSNMAEGVSGRVDIGDIDGDMFGRFILYLYTGELPELALDTAKGLYEIADKYAVEELKRACASFLYRGLTKDNACDILVLSDRHSDLEFKDAVIYFMIREKIPRTDENWPDFCDRHPKLANEVLNRCCEKFFGV